MHLKAVFPRTVSYEFDSTYTYHSKSIFKYQTRTAMEFMQPEEELKLIAEYNRRFPYKVELHVHLDGAVRPETVLEIAREREMTDKLPHKTVEELNRDVILVEPSSLERLLLSFSYFMPIITGCRKAVSRIAYERCEDAAKHSIRYMEIRYSPHLFANTVDNGYATEKGDLTPRDVVLAVNEALERGMKDFGVTVRSILCCMTHQPEWAPEVLALCDEFRDQGVVGIDLAGMEFEPGTPAEECAIKKVFKKAEKCGIHRTVHAGESGTARAVKEAIDHFRAERVGHGYHAYDDRDVYEKVIREHIHLETCPISSIMSRACEADPQIHPLKQFVKDGVSYSINTDDPVVLGNTLTDDFKFAGDMGLTDEEIIRGIFNAARSCFASYDERKRIVRELKQVYGDH
ncbi:adenosine deaminase-like isoform X2 [Dreissena polymorpha]|uniref:adenosine deaminase-like isoform X2 n=1 Tax=Dreissena polymorpha TaxID=45954 RepID=UPI0022653E96|nr:adenosine deaminase-like isoform X2 [Dreissena polymorpha]